MENRGTANQDNEAIFAPYTTENFLLKPIFKFKLPLPWRFMLRPPAVGIDKMIYYFRRTSKIQQASGVLTLEVAFHLVGMGCNVVMSF
jgi:hypothetical protein